MTLERKSYKELSPTQKQKFIDAVRMLQTTKTNGSFSIYDKYIDWHVKSMAKMVGNNEDQNLAHGGPIFLPWHREFLRRFEKDLQNAVNDPTLYLPYWNWIEDEMSPRSSEIWAEDFMGGNGDPTFNDPSIPIPLSNDTGYVVTTGPFRYIGGNTNSYTVPFYYDNGDPVVDRNGTQIRLPLLRWFQIGAEFPTSTNIDRLMQLNAYDSPDWYKHEQDNSESFRNALEGWKPYGAHNSIHVWVYGTMGQMYSPGDPLFFLNHCNVDRLWAEWQLKAERTRANWYPADRTIPIEGHNRSDKMVPWDTDPEGIPTVESVLDHHALGYKYDTEN
jgi:tyrosinase